MSNRKPSSSRPTYYQVHTRRKKRGRGKLAAALIVLLLLAAAYFFLSEFLIFTPEGIRLAFGTDVPSDESGASSGTVFASTLQDGEPRISIDAGELPPEGAGPIRGALLEVAGRTQADILSSAVNLKNLGYTAAIVPVKPSSAARISADELSWAADACETANLRFVAYLSCFRDDVASRADPALAVCDSEGELFIDYEYSAWLNPYEEAARDAVLENCRFAVSGGADELLLDHLCFPYEGNLSVIDYGDREESPHDVIGAFAQLLRETFSVYLGAVISGDDMFGEGASEVKGQDVAVFTESFDRVWGYAADAAQAGALAGRLGLLSQEAVDCFCAIIGADYVSISLLEE